jgi:hypothetical protein
MRSFSGKTDRRVPAKTELVDDLVTTLMESVSEWYPPILYFLRFLTSMSGKYTFSGRHSVVVVVVNERREAGTRR